METESSRTHIVCTGSCTQFTWVKKAKETERALDPTPCKHTFCLGEESLEGWITVKETERALEHNVCTFEACTKNSVGRRRQAQENSKRKSGHESSTTLNPATGVMYVLHCFLCKQCRFPLSTLPENMETHCRCNNPVHAHVLLHSSFACCPRTS